MAATASDPDEDDDEPRDAYGFPLTRLQRGASAYYESGGSQQQSGLEGLTRLLDDFRRFVMRGGETAARDRARERCARHEEANAKLWISRWPESTPSRDAQRSPADASASSGITPPPSAPPFSPSALKALCRSGIPQSIRPDAWFHASGAAMRQHAAPQEYARLSSQPIEDWEVDRYAHQIGLDVARTFPGASPQSSPPRPQCVRALSSFAHASDTALPSPPSPPSPPSSRLLPFACIRRAPVVPCAGGPGRPPPRASLCRTASQRTPLPFLFLSVGGGLLPVHELRRWLPFTCHARQGEKQGRERGKRESETRRKRGRERGGEEG